MTSDKKGKKGRDWANTPALNPRYKGATPTDCPPRE